MVRVSGFRKGLERVKEVYNGFEGQMVRVDRVECGWGTAPHKATHASGKC